MVSEEDSSQDNTDALITKMELLDISVRLAVAEDCKDIFQWRNAEETRKYFFDSAPIPWEVHTQWYEATLEDKAQVLLIGEEKGIPIGVLRYEIENEIATVSIYLIPGLYGKQRGTSLLKSGQNWIQQHYSTIKKIKAKVLQQNHASIRAFTKAGFIKAEFIKDYLVLNFEFPTAT